jgi:DNA-binding response OmpR family regulator
MKLALEALYAHEGKLDSENVLALLLQSKTIRAVLRMIWEGFSPAEQADLREESFTDRSVDAYLEQIGMVKEGKITVPLLAMYIRENGEKMGEVLKKIRYDENTHTIHKGASILSDQLTASEFRLLRYLIQNQEQIIERDALIAIVWEGNKSTAGITDQAVDQLVFRVRRKIEEDTNNPQHLLTVKGRGFKFVA